MIGGALSKMNKEQENNDQNSLFFFLLEICLTLEEKLHQNRQNTPLAFLNAIIGTQIHLRE